MTVLPLPYDMGNAGDFIKHGMLAEFTRWWLASSNGDFVLVDPFGGRPFVEPPHPAVTRRLAKLPDCALTVAQPHCRFRYYGSGNVVRHIAQDLGRQASVLVSDRDPAALAALLQHGFHKLQCRGFDRGDSFSIVGRNVAPNLQPTSLVLIDPYDDFLPDYSATHTSGIASLVTTRGIPVLLFVLCRDGNSGAAVRWHQLRDLYFTGKVKQLALTCSNMPHSNVKGERNYHVQSLLLLPAGVDENRLAALISRLECYSNYLSTVLDQPVSLDYKH